MRRKNVVAESQLNWPSTQASHRINEGARGATPYQPTRNVHPNFLRDVRMLRTENREQEAGRSDEVLLQAVTQKDSSAFQVLYERHAPIVYNLLICMVRNQSVAEELLQDTFWQIWQKAEQYSGRGAGIAWIHQIARHKALDQIRGQKARPAILTEDLETLEWALPQHEPSAESEFEQNWTRQQVRQALEHIPREQRICLELAYFEGLSHHEIAEQSNTPLGTIKTRIRIGMEKLERELLSCGCIHPLSSPNYRVVLEDN